jgi:hypothetical protein
MLGFQIHTLSEISQKIDKKVPDANTTAVLGRSFTNNSLTDYLTILCSDFHVMKHY